MLVISGLAWGNPPGGAIGVVSGRGDAMTPTPMGHGLVTALGGLAWSVAALCAGYLVWLGLSDRNPTFGGRPMEALIGAAPFALALLLATLAALATGGFDWVWPSLRWPALRWALVLAAMLGTAVLAAMAIGLQLAPPKAVPWILRPLRWAWWLWLPLVLLAGALALHAGATQSAPGRPWQLLLLGTGGVSLLLLAAIGAQTLAGQRAEHARQVAEARTHLSFDDREAAWLREADPREAAPTLLLYAGSHRSGPLHDLALSRLALHPDWSGVLVRALRSADSEAAFAYLDGRDPPDAAAVAAAVPDGMLASARRIREYQRAALARPEPAWLRWLMRLGLVRNDDHLREVQQICGTLDRLARLGTVPDARALDAALLELHDALGIVAAERVPPDARALVAQRLRERGVAVH